MDPGPALVPLLALLLDRLLGEPPSFLHPVRWMGWGIHLAERVRPSGRVAGLLWGGALVLGGVLVWAGIGLAFSLLTSSLPRPLAWLASAWLLKVTLAPSALARAGQSVMQALEKGDLTEARRLLAFHLVSRDTSTLSAPLVASGAIESVAENTSDGVVAPLFWYALLGLPGALAYRFVNTADAMVGYRSPAYEWAGKIPARTDDLANFLPARLTGALLLPWAPLLGGSVGRALKAWRSEARKTASPNAGVPMAVMAGLLGVALEKPGHYRLCPGHRDPVPQDIRRAVRAMWGATVLGGLLCAGVRWALAGGWG